LIQLKESQQLKMETTNYERAVVEGRNEVGMWEVTEEEGLWEYRKWWSGVVARHTVQTRRHQRWRRMRRGI
jgi:hypothetical protein